MLETATSQQCAIYKFPQCPCFVFFSFGVVFQIYLSLKFTVPNAMIKIKVLLPQS